MSRLVRAVALLAALIACPAQAQFITSPVRQPPAAAATPTAPTHTYETIGYNGGAGITIASASGAKNAAVLVGTVTSECSALMLHLIGQPSQRFLIDIGIGSTLSPMLIQNLYVNSTAYTVDATFAVNVPAGSAIYVQAQASQTSQSINVSITCRQKRAGEFPGYTKYENINPDLTQTRAGLGEASFNNAWTTIATTSRAYSAFVVMAGQTATTGVSQTYGWELGSSETGSNVAFSSGTASVQSGAVRMPAYVTANIAKPSGTPIVFRAVGTTPADLLRVGVMGAY